MFFRLHGATDDNILLINKVDIQVGEILSHAEKNCCKVGKDCTTLFSGDMAKLIRAERHKLCQINKLTMNPNYSYSVTQLQGYTQELSNIRREMRHVKVNEDVYRQNHLRTCAELYHKKNPQCPVDKYITCLIHTEKQIKQAIANRKTLEGYHPGSLTYVLIPTVDNYSQEQCDDPTFD